MGGFQLPALDIRPAPNPLDQYAKALSVKNLMGEGQLQQEQIKGAGLENQIRTQQLADQQASTKALTEWDGKDFEQLPALILKHGGSSNAVFGVRKQLLEQKQTLSKIAADDATTDSKNLETYKNRNDQIAGRMSALADVSDDQLRDEAHKTVNDLLTSQIGGKPLIDAAHGQQLAAQIDGAKDIPSLRQAIDHYGKMHLGASELAADAQKNSDVYKNIQQGNLAKAEALQKGSPLTAMENDPSHFDAAKLPGTIAYLQSKVSDASADPVDKARASRLLATAQTAKTISLQIEASKKATDQAITQGSPTVAAQLLINGDATLSQLKARGSTPEFIANTLTEAKRLSGGNFNAQQSEAQFDVAKSSSNVAFFGSAKSLIDKGGTLDQLAEAAKDIPGGQIPVFNSIADAMKAATGSGPIAKYAAILLGVADDYSKVMGGGQGSDTSRTQALKLAPANASPEARAAAIEGIRGSVESQKNSRIGANPVLKRMYGGSGESATTTGGKFSVTAPNGKNYSFPDQSSLDAFKKAAGIP